MARRTGHEAGVAAVVARLSEIEHDEGGAGRLTLDTGSLDVSNLAKIYYPRPGYTKGDLMRYYASVSPYILPVIMDRPLVMKRFPNGVTQKAFFQHRAPPNPPPSVRTARVQDEGLKDQDRLVGGDLATLLYVVQLGAMSIDPWHSRVDTVTMADYSIIDLDPGPRATFSAVVAVAREVKSSIDALGLHGVVKTSGATGMHIVLPLGPNIPNEGARLLAQVVATDVAGRRPKEATVERTVSARSTKAIYMDYLQNIRGKTVACAYSARPAADATVSTPLDWSELEGDLDPASFTIESVPGRVRDVGDLWERGMKKKNTLEALQSLAPRRRTNDA